MRITLITNPVSGGGTGRAAAERAAAAFRAAGHAAELAAWTLGGPTAFELARGAADAGADRVVAIGGDGTALDVAAGLLAARRIAPMALVPRGTANVLALNLGIPSSLDRAIETAVAGAVARIDVGTMRPAADGEPEPFLLSVGTGLHADMVMRANRAAKRRWGVLAYVGAGWSSLQGAAPTRYRLTLDGEVEETTGTMVQVMNCGAILRRSWSLGPGISPVDGRLDVLVYRARTRVEYLRVAARVVQGRPTATRLMLHRRVERVRIEADGPVGIQRDGEPSGRTPVELGVLPRALPVVVPTGSPWADPRAAHVAAQVMEAAGRR